MTRAVLFDVDFTLIYPGPTLQGEGYRAFCARHGVEVDAGRFDRAVASAASLLELPDDTVYDDEIHVRYTRHIIQAMGGTGHALDTVAREIYREWAACQHFELYDEVPGALSELVRAGLRIGLVSNSHRCLASFQSHFELEGLITAAVSSSEHGRMKPHPSIFKAALGLLDVAPEEALMVGDSLKHDVEGALQVGMRAALLHRGVVPHPRARELARRGIPVLRSLADLPALLGVRRV
ncbi:MAG TPA: HAD family hydrolase [Vicinamibacterales bacterium]|nr:HAD family hydrolase [Vicinamibacterales bacterium]